jgi:hypothetical protein
MIEAELADGTILEFPDGTDPNIIQQQVKMMIAQQSAQPAAQPVAQPAEQSQGGMFAQAAQQPVTPEMQAQASAMGADVAPAVLEPAMTMATGIPAQVASGVAGLVASPFIGTEAAQKDVMEPIQQAMTYAPKTEAGKAGLENIGKAAERISNIGMTGDTLKPGSMFEKYSTLKQDKKYTVGDVANIPDVMGKFTLDITGSPAAATAVKMAPIALTQYMGLRKLQNVRKGTPLIDNAGNPTPLLEKQLDKVGLTYDGLTPEAKALIPKRAEPGLLPTTAKGATQSQAEKTLINQIRTGGREKELAPLQVVNNEVIPDKLATQAMKQGWDDQSVQIVKTANPATRKKMIEMVNKKKILHKNPAAEKTMGRPTDIVGDAVVERVDFIKNKINTARKRMDDMASTELKGMPINGKKVINDLRSNMDRLGVKINATKDGKIMLDFADSDVVLNPGVQNSFKKIFKLIESKKGTADALTAHKMKRQLDQLIDYGSTARNPLSKEAKNVLKDFRASLNNSIRDVSPKYAELNDTMSKGLGAIDELDNATGNINLMSENAKTGLGTKMRALTSNQQGRQPLIDALQQVDDTISSLGGKFDSDIYDLNHFANALDARFGTSAKTSLAGEFEKELSRAADKGLIRTAVEKGTEKVAGKVAEKMGRTDYNAFESMKELLKR